MKSKLISLFLVAVLVILAFMVVAPGIMSGSGADELAAPAILVDAPSGAVIMDSEITLESTSNNPAAWSNISMAVMFLSVVSLTYIALTRKANDRNNRVHSYTANWRDTIRHPLKFPSSA